MLPTDVPTRSLVPAPYNPRRIAPKQEATLRESITRLGMVLPVIVNADDMTIIAGHQRTNAAKCLGIETVPCFLVRSITKGDEMSFNQLHNGVEASHDRRVTLRDGATRIIGVFSEIACDDFDVPDKTLNAPLVASMSRLMMRYGNVLSAVVACGDVVYMPEYVQAAKLLGERVNTYVVPDALADDATRYLSCGYGSYSYDGLRRDTYVQGMAQLHREPGRSDGCKAWRSVLYDNYVIPWLASHDDASVLDFGCGRGAYVRLLSQRGVDVTGVEFYHNDGQSIDVSAGNHQIDGLVSRLREHGRFACVVCDSVLNSVDSREAEASVMACLNAFSLPDGVAFISGRPRHDAEQHMVAKKCRHDRKSFVSYLDSDGFTAQYRKGHWYFQKYHTCDQVHEIAAEAGFSVERYADNGNSWKAQLRKVQDVDFRNAVRFEFSLPLPNGRRYERASDVLDALHVAMTVGDS